MFNTVKSHSHISLLMALAQSSVRVTWLCKFSCVPWAVIHTW